MRLNDNFMLNIIKFGPILFVLITSIIITSFFINKQHNESEEEIQNIEKQFILDNKKRIKGLVNRIHSIIEIEEENALNALRTLVKNEVEQSYSIINSIYKKNINSKNYSKEKVIEEIKAIVRGIRYLNNKGYLFIYELDGKNILNSEFPNIEGKNLWNYEDTKGTLLLQRMNKILKVKDSTFFDWYWKKDKNDSTEYKKIGYFKKFEPYDIFIGSGAYFDDFEKVLKKRVANKLNKIKFENFEHLFVYNLDGLCLVNPKKELVGVNRYNVKNKNGEYSLREALTFVKEKKASFRSYNSTVKLNDKLKSNEKISYLKLYEKWNWMIGSGFYLEGLNDKIEKKKNEIEVSNNEAMKSILYICLFITLVFIIFSFYISNIFRKRFNDFKNEIEKEIENRVKKEELLIQQNKMATMGEMLGSIAHQWKQPISVISMSNGLLRINKENKGFSTEEEISHSIDCIDNSVKTLTQTIDDFRNFFNPNKERIFFKISDAVTETLKLTTSQFKNNDIKLIQMIDDIELYSSQNELQQTLINLLKNSKEQLLKNNDIEKRLIFIDSYTENDNVIMKVRDNGNGISEDIIEKVFDSYFTTKEKEGGSGIGLYICKQIIEGSMKGSISVSNVTYSYEGNDYKGAEFVIVLPLDLRSDRKVNQKENLFP